MKPHYMLYGQQNNKNTKKFKTNFCQKIPANNLIQISQFIQFNSKLTKKKKRKHQ